MTEEQQAIVLEYLWIADTVAAKFAKSYHRLGIDFQSMARLGLCLCVPSYDPERKDSFGAYVNTAVKRFCFDAMKSNLPRGYRVHREGTPSFHSIYSKKTGQNYDYKDLAISDIDHVGEIEAEDYKDSIIRRLKEVMPADEWNLMLLSASGTITQREIAERRGVTRQCISGKIYRGIARARKYLEESGVIEQNTCDR